MEARITFENSLIDMFYIFAFCLWRSLASQDPPAKMKKRPTGTTVTMPTYIGSKSRTNSPHKPPTGIIIKEQMKKLLTPCIRASWYLVCIKVQYKPHLTRY